VQHSVTLTWSASTSADVVGYNVYRSTVSGGPYTKIADGIDRMTYVDNTVSAGQTYYYVTTAVDESTDQSGYSNQVTAAVPIP
jgi:fibronectin type 3 domain-containing protein